MNKNRLRNLLKASGKFKELDELPEVRYNLRFDVLEDKKTTSYTDWDVIVDRLVFLVEIARGTNHIKDIIINYEVIVTAKIRGEIYHIKNVNETRVNVADEGEQPIYEMIILTKEEYQERIWDVIKMLLEALCIKCAGDICQEDVLGKPITDGERGLMWLSG